MIFLLVIPPTAQAAGEPRVSQNTGAESWCSPAQIGTGNTVVCNGVDPRALARLNELLDRKDLDLRQKTVEAESWAAKYLEAKAYITEAEKLQGTNKEEALWLRRARELLQNGDFEEVGVRIELSRLGFSILSTTAGLSVTASRRVDQDRFDLAGPLLGSMLISELDLSNTSISDLQPLRSITTLRDLNIQNTLVHEIEPISSLLGLKKLDISDTAVSEITAFKSLDNLTRVCMSQASIQDMRPMSHLKNLKWILIGTNESFDLGYLKDLPMLAVMYIDADGPIEQRLIAIHLEQVNRYRIAHKMNTIKVETASWGRCF